MILTGAHEHLFVIAYIATKVFIDIYIAKIVSYAVWDEYRS